jgi:hypothetical protein
MEINIQLILVMTRTPVIRGFNDKVHEKLGDLASQRGISINSIARDAVDKWLKQQQSEVIRKHYLIIYSDDESMIKLLKDYFTGAGFKYVTMERHDMFFNFNSPDQFTNFVCETASPVQVMLSNQSEERKKEILKAVGETVANNYVDKNSDSISFRNEAICIAGTK